MLNSWPRELRNKAVRVWFSCKVTTTALPNRWPIFRVHARMSFALRVWTKAVKSIESGVAQVMYSIWGELFVQDDVIKWKHFLRYWPFVRGIHRSPVNSPHNGQWRGALMFTLICARINGWVNNRQPGDLRRHRAIYDVIVMICRVEANY